MIVIFKKDLGIQQRSTGETLARRANVGETVVMKWPKRAKNILLAAAFASLWVSGCGSKSTANQVLVSVSGSFSVMVPTQSQTIVAIVTGATDVSATTATPSPKPSASAACDTAKTAGGDPAVGVLSNVQNTSTTVASTATFTAPKVFPDQTKLPNVLVTITATANADKKKTGKFTISFDSGIRITLVPATATLGTGETQLFLAKDFNANVISPDQLTWGVTFEVTARTNSADCSTGSNSCGSIDATGFYKAPTAVPTAAPASTTTPVNAAGIVTVFAFSKVDNARIAQSAVTVVKAGDITFSGISPSIAPQGGVQQDIFLAATNATSQIGVTLVGPQGNVPINAQSQIKVVFAAGATSSSIGARVRLSSAQLTTPGHYTVQVTSPNTSITVTGGPFPLDIVPVRPTIVSSTPNNFEESALGQTGGLPFVIDGGFFGLTPFPTVAPEVNGHSLLANAITPRRISSNLPLPIGSSSNAGLFPVSVKYSTSPGPFAAPASTTAYTNIAVLPDYGGTNPPLDLSNSPLSLQPVSSPPPTVPPKIYCLDSTPPCTGPITPLISFGASSAPSSIAMDPTDGLAIVTLAGVNSNNVQIINLSGGTPSLMSSVSSGGSLATGVAVDDQLSSQTPSQPNVAAVVNYASRSLAILSVPAGTSLGTLNLGCAIPQTDTTCQAIAEPFPYSVGIDPFSHRAVVAFASTNIGLIVNLNADPSVTAKLQCLPSPPNTTWTLPYCPIGYVTLSSGPNPQVAFEPGARLAYVTPGGAGLLSAVDLANPSKGSLGIPVASATRASNVVTVTTSSSHNLNPGNPGTVLISGLPKGSTNQTNFDGSFSVGVVLDATHFQYSQADKDDTSTCTATCLASSGVPFLTYTISPSIAGIAFNPVTRQGVLADPNATSSQITFIDPQSQSVTSMSLFSEQTGQVSTGSPELGAADVAFQPFSNTVVSFNPKTNEVSLLDPSLAQRPAIVTTGQSGLTTLCFTGGGSLVSCTSTNPTPTSVTIPGAIAVDSVNNLALTLNSGSGTLTGFKLGKIKAVHIERVATPGIDDATKITAPASLAPAVKITLGTAPAAVGPVKVLGNGFDAGSQVRLDGVPFASSTRGNFTFVSSHEIDVTIPVSTPDPGSPGGTLTILAGPRHFALDVVDSSGSGSNVTDFTVLEEIPLAPCNVTTAAPNGTPAAPGGVAIDEVNNLAVVTNTGSGCSQVSVFSLNPATIFNQTVKTIATGDTPTGIAVLPRLTYTGQAAATSGVAVVTNNGSNSVSVLDLVNAIPVNDASGKAITVNVGTAPSGVAIDQETNLAVIANTNSNTVSTIDLTPLAATPIGALTPITVAVNQSPIAVAIDPDRGTNGRGLAVVTSLVLNGASSPFGALDAVDIGSTTPIRSTSASTSFLSATPTGVVFDPAVSPALFYAVSTQGNVITAFNPDAGTTQTIRVGINPNAIAYNFQTGTILTVNSLSNTISIVDSQTFATKATLGIGAASRFAAAIQTLTNLAVIADQANNRVILFPVPK
jgi:DNA-binding beta-propeller fold protein YncE